MNINIISSFFFGLVVGCSEEIGVEALESGGDKWVHSSRFTVHGKRVEIVHSPQSTVLSKIRNDSRQGAKTLRRSISNHYAGFPNFHGWFG